MTDLEWLITINAVSSISVKGLTQRLERFGSYEAIIHSNPGWIKRYRSFNLRKELQLIKQNQVFLVTYQDSTYPNRLREINSSPILLYMKGALGNAEISLGVVGARKATPYGLKVAHQWSCELAEMGVTVISGLALGIDGAAHQGALEGGGRTVAVLGSGLANIYPAEHQKLSDQIAEQGALISEFPMQSVPLPDHFPRRNRIISALSMGLLVVEANQKSGSLITASQALDQGKEVFAIPGRIDSRLSQGTNELIKDGAHLALSVEDIIQGLALPIVSHSAEKPNDPTDSISQIMGQEAMSLDQLAEKRGLTPLEVMAQLTLLEMRGKVIKLPGLRYMKR